MVLKEKFTIVSTYFHTKQSRYIKIIIIYNSFTRKIRG